MDNKNSQEFEDSLKDILTPDDKVSAPSSQNKSRERNNTIGRNNIIKLQSEKSELYHFPRWVETLIRIIASIVAITLLILFGFHIAGK